MNKEIWENFKKIIDEFIAREELLKSLLKEKEEKIADLEKSLKEIYE